MRTLGLHILSKATAFPHCKIESVNSDKKPGTDF
jgi:hypothetical protein